MTVEFSPSVWLAQTDEVAEIAKRGALRAADAIEGTVAPSGSSPIDQTIHQQFSRLRTEATQAAS